MIKVCDLGVDIGEGRYISPEVELTVRPEIPVISGETHIGKATAIHTADGALWASITLQGRQKPDTYRYELGLNADGQIWQVISEGDNDDPTGLELIAGRVEYLYALPKTA